MKKRMWSEDCETTDTILNSRISKEDNDYLLSFIDIDLKKTDIEGFNKAYNEMLKKYNVPNIEFE